MDAISISCFKAYDIRGRVPDQLNDDVAYRVGRACAEFLEAKTIVVGHDVRFDKCFAHGCPRRRPYRWWR